MRRSGFMLVGCATAVLLLIFCWYLLNSGADTTALRSAAPGTAATSPAAQKPDDPPKRIAPIYFEDLSDELGVDFVSHSGTTPDRHFPTANGTGVAMLDFDQDGRLDLYFANACRLDSPTDTAPNALFRSRAAAHFEAVTQSSGTAISGFTQGLAVADTNNDGFPDLYLTRYGPNILLENMGDGTFQDRTAASGLGDLRWGTSAAFLDFDEDGNVDLYVANYGQWDMAWHHAHFCGSESRSQRVYCSPKLLDPELHGLFRSLGDGSFLDVAAELGIARRDGRGQGVVACDVNNDGHIDLYVANDLTPNFLFLNSGRGRFQDVTEISCAGYNDEGNVEAGMGVDASDVDGDGLPELFVTNFYLEHNTLYRNLGKSLFQDVSNSSGVTNGSIHAVGWGTALEDLDGDGWLDIFVTNGHVDDNVARLFGRDEPFAQLPRLWRNLGKGRFHLVQDDAGPSLRTPHVGRGAAFGDLDNDGAIDIVTSCKDERASLLLNRSRQHHSVANCWIQLALVGTRSQRDAIGTRVELELGTRRISRQIRGGKSYLSAHDLRLTIGLGDAQRVERLSIHWPSGQTTILEGLSANRTYQIREPLGK